MFLENHYQNAYVTRNIEQAMGLFREKYGLANFKHFQVATELSTPAGRGTAVTKIALGWVGRLQYELIEPVSGMIDVYETGLPDRYPMRFHHCAMRVHDWDTFRAEVERRGWPVAIEGVGTGGLLKFLYVDARESLGHYLEYCWMTPERWASMGGP